MIDLFTDIESLQRKTVSYDANEVNIIPVEIMANVVKPENIW